MSGDPAAMPILGRFDVVPAAAPPPMTHRLAWASRYGVIVMDVVGDQIFVNGEFVEPVPR